MLDLLVTMGIIVTLIAILLPALVRAREQSQYVRWQAFSRDESMDPNLMIYWNFQLDQGSGKITNMAVANQDALSFVASDLDGVDADTRPGSSPRVVDTNTSDITYLWSQYGRFRGKPGLTFSGTAPGGNSCIYLAHPEKAPEMAHMLEKSQAVTIVTWVEIPAANFVQADCTPIAWGEGTGQSTAALQAMQVSLPGGSAGIGWQTNTDLCAHPLFNYGNNGNWTMWAFTKDANAGVVKIYQNGQLFAFAIGKNIKWGGSYGFDVANPFASTDFYGFHVGQEPQIANWIGTIDELAIFDADLSPQDVNPASGAVSNLPATRFLQMYQMGLPQ
jgi:hypothetical protein